jgi:hypothetical protein
VKALVLRLLALLPIPVVVALVIWAGRRPVPPPPVLPKVALPGPDQVAAVRIPTTLEGGWKVQGKLERYDKKTLFDRIDGAAPAYIRAGFVYSVGAELSKEGMKESVVADIYAMGSPPRALGMYATERDRSYSFIEVGEEGYLASGSLNFWQGEFYVKLAGYEEGEAMDAALKELAANLGTVLPKTPPGRKWLAPLGMLPAEDRMPNSDGYSHPPLGDVEGLSEVFYAGYKGPGEGSYRLFVGRFKDEAEAARRFEQARAYFQRDAKVAQSSEGSARVLVVEGESVSSLVLQQGRVVAGGIDLTSTELVPVAKAKLLKTLAASTDGAKKAEAP